MLDDMKKFIQRFISCCTVPRIPEGKHFMFPTYQVISVVILDVC